MVNAGNIARQPERIQRNDILDAYAQGDAGDRLALFLGYRDMRRAFRAVDMVAGAAVSEIVEPGRRGGSKRLGRCRTRLASMLFG